MGLILGIVGVVVVAIIAIVIVVVCKKKNKNKGTSKPTRKGKEDPSEKYKMKDEESMNPSIPLKVTSPPEEVNNLKQP